MDLSIVVSTYGRLESFQRLVWSARHQFGNIQYEIVAVASDLPGSEKCIWAQNQHDITLVCVGDRSPGSRRSRSLYFYENLGIENSKGTWIFITNDDTEFSSGSGKGFQEMKSKYDVLVLPAEIDDPALGKRAPVIGELEKHGIVTPLLLMDFAFFRSDFLRRIGPADEGFDWFGAGADRSIQLGLLGAKVGVINTGGLTHHLEKENRVPPNSNPDFRYLRKKWQTFESKNPGVRIRISGDSDRGLIPLWVYRFIWPIYDRFRRFFRK